MSEIRSGVGAFGIEGLPFMEGFIRMCTDGWDQGWHEANGGNASYRMTADDVASAVSFFGESGPWVPIDVQAENLAGEHFVVTGTGKFMRNVALAPAECRGIVEISPDAGAYRVVWGLEGAAPTSEFLGHLLIHAIRKDVSGGADRVVYHCHPIDVVALTDALPLDGPALTQLLWHTMTECIMIFPEGVGFVGCLTPGSLGLAKASAVQAAAHRAIVWSNHGLLATGPDFDSAFGLVHVIVKACAMYRAACQIAGGSPRNLVSDEALAQIREDMGL